MYVFESAKEQFILAQNTAVDDAKSAEIYERIGTRVIQTQSRRHRVYTGSGLCEDKKHTSSVDVLLVGCIRMISPFMMEGLHIYTVWHRLGNHLGFPIWRRHSTEHESPLVTRVRLLP